MKRRGGPIRDRTTGPSQGGGQGSPGFAVERPGLWIGLFLAINLFFCLTLFDPKLHTGGDSSHYVLLAESVLRTGDGYADSREPGDPVPHIQYPPGYPLLLAPLVALFGRDFVLLKLFSVALTALSVLVFSVLTRERTGSRERASPTWILLALAFAVNPVVVDYSHWLLSEAAFLLFTLLALLFLQREQEEEGIGKYFWLGLLAMVGAYYVRSIAAVFLAAGSLSHLIGRRWKKFLWFSLPGAALSLPWLVRNRVLGGAATPYIEQFLLKSVYEPEAGSHDLWGMVGRLFTNLWIYAARELPRVFVGSESGWAATGAMKVLSLALFAFMVVGFARALRRGPGAAELFFALSWLAILLFEEVVSDVRYLVPLVPLILVYLHDGLVFAGKRLSALRNPAVPAIAATALIAAIGAFAQLQRVPENVDMLRRYAGGDRYAGYHPVWRSFFTALDWVGANTPEDAVVTVRKPRLLHIWTDRKVVLYPFSSEPDSVLDVILGTDYVVVDQVSATTGRYLLPAIERAPERFEVVFQSEAPMTWVLRVLDAPAVPE